MEKLSIITLLAVLFVSGCNMTPAKQLRVAKAISLTASDYLDLARAEAQKACDQINETPCKDAEKYARYKTYADTAVEFLSQDITEPDWDLAFTFADMVIAKLEAENADAQLIFFARQIRTYLELAFEEEQATTPL